jgi:hypothetical protein
MVGILSINGQILRKEWGWVHAVGVRLYDQLPVWATEPG